MGDWSRNDGARILGFRTPVMNYANVVLKGNPVQYEVDKLPEKDRQDLTARGLLPIVLR